MKRSTRLRIMQFSTGLRNRLFSEGSGSEVSITEIGPEQSFWKGWRQLNRIWSPIPDCSDIYTKLIVKMYEELKGQAVLVALNPEHVAFGWDEYVLTLRSLDDELVKPHRIALKTAHPSRRMCWGNEEIVPYQYVFDIREVASVQYYLRRFTSFDMLKILILKPVADAREKAADLLQKFCLDQVPNLDPILEYAAYLVYYDYNGIILNVVAERARLDTISAYILQLTGTDGGAVELADR